MLPLRINSRHTVILVLMIACFLVSSCARIPKEQRLDNGTTVIISGESDSLASLAAAHLAGPEDAWIIAGFNQASQPIPGQPIAIPGPPFRAGGIYSDGYQIVPVLAYERFSRKKKGKWVVTETDFEAQLQFLQEQAYQPISLEALDGFLRFEQQIPEKAVLITIDDGWRSAYDIAFPLLKKYGFPAAVFVYTDFVGAKSAVTWDQLKTMAASGIDVQCKALTKDNLALRKPGEILPNYLNRLAHELSASRHRIQETLGRPCHYLAYPYGNTNALLEAIARKEGFTTAFTLEPGDNSFFVNRFRVHRVTVSGLDNLPAFQQKISVFRKKDLR